MGELRVQIIRNLLFWKLELCPGSHNLSLSRKKFVFVRQNSLKSNYNPSKRQIVLARLKEHKVSGFVNWTETAETSRTLLAKGAFAVVNVDPVSQGNLAQKMEGFCSSHLPRRVYPREPNWGKMENPFSSNKAFNGIQVTDFSFNPNKVGKNYNLQSIERTAGKMYWRIGSQSLLQSEWLKAEYKGTLMRYALPQPSITHVTFSKRELTWFPFQKYESNEEQPGLNGGYDFGREYSPLVPEVTNQRF